MKQLALAFVVAFSGLLGACDGAAVTHFRDGGPDADLIPLLETYDRGCIDEQDCETLGSVCLVENDGARADDSFCSLPCAADPACPAGGSCVPTPAGAYCMAD